MEEVNNNVKLLSRPELRRRGWTDGLILRYFPVPTSTRANPKYRTGPKMKLYSHVRIEEIEATAEFQAALVIAAKKRRAGKAGSQKGLATKEAKLEKYIDDLRIDVPQLSREQLIEQACKSYNLNSFDKHARMMASADSDAAFLARICVNYLRHCETPYEIELQRIAGKTGCRDAYYDLKTKTLYAIDFEYPWLADECARQRERLQQQQFNEWTQSASSWH